MFSLDDQRKPLFANAQANRLLKTPRLTAYGEYDSVFPECQEDGMRGSDLRSGELFSYIDLEERVPAKHLLRKIRQIVNDMLSGVG